MRTVLRASLRTHTRRYISAAVAVVIGVSFIVVTSLLSDATRAGLVAGVEVPYRGADVVVTDVDADEAARIVDEMYKPTAEAVLDRMLRFSGGHPQTPDFDDRGRTS